MFFNKVIEAGNLVRDVELKYLPTGTAVGNFTLAVRDKYGDKEETMFIDVVVFGKLAEICSQYTGKGSSVLVDGRLQQQTWDDKSGNKKSKIQIIGQVVRFITTKEKMENKSEPNPEGKVTNKPKTEDTDDLEPF